MMGQGKKAEAAAKLRDRKAAEVALAEIYAKDPSLKARLTAPPKKVEPPAQAAPKLSLSILEIYEAYHDPELLQSVAVIDAELARCNDLMP